MKTRREHLSVLPAEILEDIKQEIKQELKGAPFTESEILEHPCAREEALKGVFIFATTAKGHGYWWAIHEKYFK